jgi:hypothetical protein
MALATCAEFPQLEENERLVLPALQRLGIDAEVESAGRPVSGVGRVRPGRGAQHPGLPVSSHHRRQTGMMS